MPIRASSAGLGLALVAAFLVPSHPSLADVPLCDDSVPTIVGTEGPDVLFGTPGPDVIVGLGGDDQISGPLDDGDAVCGNDGNDTIIGSGAIGAFGGPGDDYIEVLGDPGVSYSGLYGNQGDDTIVAAQDWAVTGLYGGPGDDILRGGPGPDSLAPGSGKDTVDGGTDLECGNCDDVLMFRPDSGPVSIDMARGFVKGQGRDTIVNIENTSGTRSSDRIVGSDGPNILNEKFSSYGTGYDHISGLGGDDDIYGHGVLLGGPGDDRIEQQCCREGPTDDVFDGGDGHDILLYEFYGPRVVGPVTLNLAAGTSTGPLTGNDQVLGIEDAVGTRQADTFIGDALANYFSGRAGHDRLSGGDGNDDLEGGYGPDQIFGEAGDDRLDGGQGDTNTLNGGPGVDSCRRGAPTECES